MDAPCDDPSRYRYQRGCRCPGCVEAQAIYKREYRERKAREQGRVLGEKPCAMCGQPISVLGSSNRRIYCGSCAELALKESRRVYRQRRDERNPGKHITYMREYYRANRDKLDRYQRQYRERNRSSMLEYFRQYQARADVRAKRRARYAKKNPPTVHERALEAYGFLSSAQGGRAGSFRIQRCKCGCGLPINAAHVAVARLYQLGYSRPEIAARLGVHETEVSQLDRDGQARTWAWYRRGHGNLSGAKRQPTRSRQPMQARRWSRETALQTLIEQQDTEISFGQRQKSVSGRSLDAVIAGTDGLALVDTIAAPTATGDFTDTEESLFDWLYRNDIKLEELAERCASDRELAAEMAESTELGHPTRRVIELLLPESVAA